MSAPISAFTRMMGARYPGPLVPHIAISREERDLAYAGYGMHRMGAGKAP
jgi:hypothetical protein